MSQNITKMSHEKYTHIGKYKWEKSYVHLLYNLNPYDFTVVNKATEAVTAIEMPASIMFMSQNPHVFTEFVRQKLIHGYHKKEQKQGYYYFYKGVDKYELIDTIEKLKKYFTIDKKKFDAIKNKLVLDAI